MKTSRHFYRLAAAAGLAALATGFAGAVQAKDVLGVTCSSPPPLHCPAAECPGDLIANLGNATETTTGRKYFLDYPCDLKAGEKVIFVLNLHGGGSIGNWQRHYFPIMDLKEKYRLVIASPSGSNNGWNAGLDDGYLRGIVEQVEGAFGKDNIKAFWLAGHSMGGQTSNRLINNDEFFRKRLVGWVSLSGGRLGSKRADVRATIPAGSGGPGGAPPPAAGAAPAGAPPAAARPPRPAGAAPAGAPLGVLADASVLPTIEFTHIYETGEHELTAAGLPGESKWAEKLKCRPQAKPVDVVDTKPGYVYDSRRQATPNPIWGGKPAPGVSKVYAYPGCPGRRAVYDIVRMGKGHTEGLEPVVTEEIVKIMVAAS